MLAAMISQGPRRSWWDVVKTVSAQPEEMSYDCNANLGAPREVDCELLGYSQLGPPSDSITITPQAPRLLSSNSCNVAIESTTSVAITWAQISTALNALIDICVSASVTGGKAYYSPLKKPRRDLSGM